MNIIIYHEYVPKVGGIETAVYSLARLLSEYHDITIAFRSSEVDESIFHYADVARVVRLREGVREECDVCLLASNHPKPKEIEAKKYLQWIHSDYAKYNLRLANKGEVEYVSVSEHVAKVINKLEGVESKVIYNLVSPDFKRKKDPLKLITVSRVSPEKGFGRMLKLAEALKSANVEFIWHVLGDNSHHPHEYQDWIAKFKHIEQVYFVGYKSDVIPLLQEADYLVQLSDWEGCPYAVLEALKLKIPCIVTDWGGVGELIKHGKNGFVLDMELSNLDIDAILAKSTKVTQPKLSSVEDWLEIIE